MHDLGIACHFDAKQAARERPDGVAAHSAAKIEHEGGMTSEPGFRRLPLDLLDQPGLADPCLAADKNGLPAPGLAARRQFALQQAKFSVATNERALLARNGPQAKKAPCPNWFGKTFDVQRAGIDPFEPVSERTTRIIRGQDFALFSGGG